ncbi:hypothetical protein PFY01_09080 [Brevundimonas vesicularis]|uniref:hypothetical protein n=1 Tax=Brevundimonas vesicularis TaxID=41276 RepID=UPI0022EC85A3|nr:hypothetical protein [Brevundimonas vesicularis]WBT04811.1 hypothetical protein PFY01_08650 [Brevundimonas vesicularis]WBT04895.1 hypothetical protein PFY01_09080 [Brevundimonas vesicularis]
MNIFVVVSLVPNSALQMRIHQSYPGNVLNLSDSATLIAATGTAQDISTTIGLASGEFNSAVVIGMSTYHGRAPVDIWDWMKAKIEAPAHG